VALLMADQRRHGELIFSECGNFRDLENGERGFHAVTKDMLGISKQEELLITQVMEKIRSSS
jgi:hypothetical protein